jgi:hypothetical protein
MAVYAARLEANASFVTGSTRADNDSRRDNPPAHENPVASPPVTACAGLCFRGLGCGKFSISVWLGARGAGVQFTSLSDRCATGIARHE